MSIDNVLDVTPRVQYTAAAAQTAFDYPFPIFEDADLVVDVDGVTKALSTHYTVTGEGDDTGGTVTFLSGMTGGETVTIYRDIPIERTSDFQTNGPLRSSTFNDELDRITMILQQLEAKLGRSLRLPITGEATDAQNELSPIENWLSKYITINASGVPEPATLVSGTISQSIIAALLNPLTADESALGLTNADINSVYLAYNVKRYGATGDGVTNDAPAFQKAINLAKRTGGEVIVPCPTDSYLLTSALDCTYSAVASPVRGFVIRGQGTQIAATENSPSYPMIRMQHTGHGFDCTGALGITFENLTIGTHASTFPQTCFLLARNSGGSGSLHRFKNVRTYGKFSEAVVYNYGAEEDEYHACQLYNTAGSANAKVIVWTQTNIRNLTSTFQTIATGVQSTLGHYVFGGSFFNVSHNAAADTFYLESAALVKIYAPHMHCGDGTGGGRSLIYVDTTNGASDNLMFDGIAGEVANVPAYGIYIGDTVRTVGNWIVLGCRFPHATNMIKAHANITGSGLHFINVTTGGTGTGGINFAGVLSASYATNVAGGITAGTLGENSIDLFNKVIEKAGEARVTLRNTSGATDEKNWMIRGQGTELYFSGFNDALGSSVTPLQLGRTGVGTSKIGFQGTSPIAKPAVTGSKGANAALTSLLTALANYGLITDSSS